jgi:thioredoxin-related protein
MKVWRHLLWMGMLAGFLALAEAPRDPMEHFFDQSFGDFPEELARARDEGKKGILLFFEMDECPFCHRMKQTVLNQPRVQDFYHEHFLSFVVDVGGDLEIIDFDGEPMSEKDFAFKQNRVRATPVFQFYDLEGQPVARFTGATSGVEEFLWLGEYVAEGHYQDMPFTRFKRERGQTARP